MRLIPTALLALTVMATAQPATAAPKKAPSRPATATGSGDVTRAQMQAQVKQIFDLADADHDGFMTRAEFGRRMTAVLNRTPPGTPGAPTKEQAQQMLDAATAAFKAVDANGDSKLSRAEAGKRPLAAFDMMDANHDGILTLAEKVAARRPGAGAVPTPSKKLEPGR
ncbi:MAG TPA: hypothetical protein VF649_04600 [Sphingomonas sp.]|jgi:hypothetical protein|uniref:EF-hand domain-containing protein n=1 Tax=Sphingomonas sp. TaxID=28214 RepID=UPI002ED7CAE2